MRLKKGFLCRTGLAVARKGGVVEDEYTVSKLKEKRPAGVWAKRAQRHENPTLQGGPVSQGLCECVSIIVPALR